MKTIIAALAALFVLTASPAFAALCTSSSADATEIFAGSSPSVVAIEATRTGNELYGSGFFWDNQGHIVTNIHVLGQDTTVILANGQRVKPQLVGYDATFDVAVLRIPFVSSTMGRGSSAILRVGEPVFAIGNPYGVGISLSRGIVSGLNRSIETTERRHLFNLVQTDAALNPGNSGGPLIDQRGCLIGMNTAILSPSNTSSGVGFALTVEQLAQVIPGILSGRGTPVASGEETTLAPAAKPVSYGTPNYSHH
ncbi:MAG: trypsin-like peptidase domain-containing protein [Proteobacteria bacterium]|nr:trypsin-like peptidase domain-containing protein [Pseudomonadota bacterium]